MSLLKIGDVVYLPCMKDGTIYLSELCNDADTSIQDHIDASGNDPDYVLELRAVRIGKPAHSINWGKS
jgi:hypothetical protein